MLYMFPFFRGILTFHKWNVDHNVTVTQITFKFDIYIVYADVTRKCYTLEQ